MTTSPTLSTQFLGMTLKSPVMIASCDVARTSSDPEKVMASGAGAVILKSVTELQEFQQKSITQFLVLDHMQRPTKGKPPGNYHFFSRGGPMQPVDKMLAVLPNWVAAARKHDVRLIGSISAGTMEGWVRTAEQLAEAGVDALELNFGNPHAGLSKAKMGMKISQAPASAAEVVAAIRKVTSIPLIAKLSPHAPDFISLGRTVMEAGADALTVMHRFQGLMIDPETMKPRLGGYNGIGGPWMKPVSLYWVSRVYNEIGCPISGGNGADTAEDVVEFMLAGASVVQMASSIMVQGLGLIEHLNQGILHYLKAHGLKSPADLIGKAAEQLRVPGGTRIVPRQVRLNSDACGGCHERPCLEACYFGALSLPGERPVLGPECNGCGFCIFYCPVDGALELIEG